MVHGHLGDQQRLNNHKVFTTGKSHQRVSGLVVYYEVNKMKLRRIMLLIALTIALIFTSAVVAMAETSAANGEKENVELLSVSSYSYNKIRLKWNPIEDVDGYVIYRATSKNGSYKKIATINNQEKSSYINGSRTTGKRYYYKLRAFKTIDGKLVYTKYSGIKSSYARPGKPTVTYAKSPDGGRNVTIKWSKVAGATGYKLYAKYENKWMLMKTTSKISTSIIDYGDAQFKVKAFRTVKGKRQYSLYSVPFSYDSPWDDEWIEENPKQEGEIQSTKTFYLKKYNVYMDVGTKYTIPYHIEPVQELTWTSSDNALCPVTSDGVISPKSPGRYTITVKDKQGNKRSCYIYASEDAVPKVVDSKYIWSDGSVHGIQINGQKPEFVTEDGNSSTALTLDLGIKVGDDYYALGGNIKATSSNKNVVEVENSYIKLKGVGTATINISSDDPYTYVKSTSITVNVTSGTTRGDIAFYVEDITLIDTASKYSFFEVYYKNGKLADIQYLDLSASSSDESVARAETNFQGLVVYPVAEGDATITVTTNLGTSASFKVMVVDAEAKRIEQTQDMLSKINENMTPYEKLHTMCEYILENYTYKFNGHSAKAMFMQKGGDCWAYSGLVNCFAKELGFESVTYKQIWEGNVHHTSNRVKAGGKWYYVDCSINRGTTYDLFETTDPYQENPDAVV